jgi:hypothetical protein
MITKTGRIEQIGSVHGSDVAEDGGRVLEGDAVLADVRGCLRVVPLEVAVEEGRHERPRPAGYRPRGPAASDRSGTAEAPALRAPPRLPVLVHALGPTVLRNRGRGYDAGPTVLRNPGRGCDAALTVVRTPGRECDAGPTVLRNPGRGCDADPRVIRRPATLRRGGSVLSRENRRGVLACGRGGPLLMHRGRATPRALGAFGSPAPFGDDPLREFAHEWRPRPPQLEPVEPRSLAGSGARC